MSPDEIAALFANMGNDNNADKVEEPAEETVEPEDIPEPIEEPEACLLYTSAIRYAGDEFIVLLSGVDTERVLATMEEINHNLSRFNESGIEPFRLSAVSYTHLDVYKRQV